MTRPAESSSLEISWPMLAFSVALVVSVVAGAIQLGSVQTHVQINTDTLGSLQNREHQEIERRAKLEEQMLDLRRRIERLEKTSP